MKLYYKPGACSLASHIVLNEIGAAFTLEKVDTASGRTETGDDYATVNPNGYVPALRLETGAVVTENPALLQYLGDLAPERDLVPAPGTLARIRVQELLSFLASELHKAYGPFFSGRDLNQDDIRRAHATIARRIGHLDRLLEDGRDHLTGDAFTVADAYAFVILNWSGAVGFDLARWPAVLRFQTRVAARPAVQKALVMEGLLKDEAA